MYRYIFWFDNGNGGSSMSNLMLGVVLMFGIAMIICIGCILAKGSQDHIDYMNDRIRKDQKWRDRNNG